MNGKVRRGGLIGPAILIGLGVVLLLNNLGVVAWSVWEVILRLWPILLIALGLDILIGRRSLWGSLLALLLTMALLAGALWLLGPGMESGPVRQVEHALDGAAQAEVIIAPGAGTLHMEALSESDSLVEGTIHLGAGPDLEREFVVEDDTARLILRREGGFVSIGGWGGRRSWDLGLTPEVPLDLEVNIGAGESHLDLTGLTVSRLDVSMGLGQTTVVLPSEGRFRAEIEGAIGEIVIVIPAGLEARVEIDTGLAGRRVPTSYRRQDNVYTSPEYGSTENRVDLKVSQAIGSITIRQP
ncbi:MAG: DUF5668 domain-containing protein [Anaerolineae bacterium]|jgi:hypothetical protein